MLLLIIEGHSETTGAEELDDQQQHTGGQENTSQIAPNDPQADNLLGSNPDARQAIEDATGLSGDDLDRVIDGLADAGVAPTLRPNADSDARYAHAVGLVRSHGYSLRGAAREAGFDHSNFRKRLKRMNEKIPDAETLHRAAEERILTRAEELSEMAAEKLISDVEPTSRLRLTTPTSSAYSIWARMATSTSSPWNFCRKPCSG